MPTANSPDGVIGASQPDEGSTIPRLSLTEIGFSGLKISNKQIQEEASRAFRYPAIIKTINEIENNPTVGACLNVYRFMMTRVNWKVLPPVNATSTEKERARLISTMMHDMEHTWASFIESVIPVLRYGFALNEMVLYRRLKRNGSAFNDGLIGIKKLPTRSQDTISGWNFTEDGNTLISVKQSLRNLENAYKFMNRTDIDGFIDIPYSKLLHFTTNQTKGNPEGRSIFSNIYLAYKQMTLLQEQQLISIAKEAKGMLKIELPAQYLAGTEAPDKGVAAEAFKKIIDGHNNGTTAGLLVPQQYDPESKLPMFSYSLLESKGSNANNVESVIKGLQQDILSALSVDVLKLGADGSGSFSLAESKTSILALAIDSKLKEISSVLNSTLMKMLYQMNGWSCENMATFSYESTEEVDLTDFSSAVQRIFAVGGVEMTRDLMNRIRVMLGVQPLPDDEPVHSELLPANMSGVQSKSGEGMKSPTGNGTAKDPFGSGDTSVANKEN